MNRHPCVVRIVLCVTIAALFAACGQQLEAPPFQVQYRESLLGAGKILQITNAGAEPLTAIQVKIKAPNGDLKNHSLGTLAAGEMVELGWKKLDGFQIPTGSDISLECEGYLLPYEATLTEPAPQG